MERPSPRPEVAWRYLQDLGGGHPKPPRETAMYSLAHTGFSFLIYAILGGITLVGGIVAKIRSRR